MRKELEKYSKYKDDNIEWIGKIPDHWNATKLKHLCVLQRGFDLPSQDRQEGQFPIYGGGGITGYHSKAMVQPPGVVTGRYGTVGEVFLVNEPFWPLNTSLYVKEFWSNLPGFVRYVLAILPMETYSAKAAVPGINRNIIHQIPIAIPPLFEQKAIAHYLDTKTAQIDLKIDLLTQKATLYSNLKQSLINEIVTRGLDKSVPMKDSGIEWLGEVPEHWEMIPVCKVIRNRTEKNTANKEDEYLSLVAGIGVIPYAEKGNVGNKKPESLEKCKMVYPGDFVLNSMNFGIGSFGISRFKGVCSSVYIVMRPKYIDSGEFLYRFFQIKPFQAYMASFGKGIMEIRMAIKWSDLKNFYIPYPPLPEQQAIAHYLDTKTAQIDQIIQTINTQIEKLKELRKTLINDVVTGKIKVV